MVPSNVEVSTFIQSILEPQTDLSNALVAIWCAILTVWQGGDIESRVCV